MALPLAFLLLAAAPQDSIIVTGHAWAPFISPMGEPFRAKTVADDTLALWFGQADTNGDGFLTANELEADAVRFFAKLDTSHDGELDPDEIAEYEHEIAPEIQVMSGTKRLPGQSAAKPNSDEDAERRRQADFSILGIGGALQGAARYSLLDIPEPVIAADADFNRGVSLAEFRAAARERFSMLDKAGRGRVSLAELRAMRPAPQRAEKPPKLDEKAPDTRVGSPLPKQP